MSLGSRAEENHGCLSVNPRNFGKVEDGKDFW